MPQEIFELKRTFTTSDERLLSCLARLIESVSDKQLTEMGFSNDEIDLLNSLFQEL